MSELKISANLNEALEFISKKIGVASDKIIEEYTKNMFVVGWSSIIGCILAITLPWLLFIIDIPIPQEGYSRHDLVESPSGYQTLFFVLKGIVCFVFTVTGIYTMVGKIENILTPKALAIHRLLKDIKKII